MLNQQISDEELSTYKLEQPAETPRGIWVKRLLEKHQHLRIGLLIVVLLGTCMVIGDGVLTPAISGTNLHIPCVPRNEVIGADLSLWLTILRVLSYEYSAFLGLWGLGSQSGLWECLLEGTFAETQSIVNFRFLQKCNISLTYLVQCQRKNLGRSMVGFSLQVMQDQNGWLIIFNCALFVQFCQQCLVFRLRHRICTRVSGPYYLNLILYKESKSNSWCHRTSAHRSALWLSDNCLVFNRTQCHCTVYTRSVPLGTASSKVLYICKVESWPE